jgi:tetratricopeptide (TPR) repeat protein
MFLRLSRLLFRAGLPALLCVMMLSMSGCFLFGGGSSSSDEESEEIVDPEQTLTQGFLTTFEVGQTLMEAGQLNEALLIYYEALAQDSTGYGAAKCWNAIGDIYLDDGEYEKAFETYQKLMANFTVVEDSIGVERKMEFVKAARLVREERLKVANEGASHK